MYYGEKLNSITHLVGAVMALVGFGALLAVGVEAENVRVLLSYSLFGLTLVLLYTMSTLYHSFSSDRVKNLFRKLDNVAIYLLIAGTYTPYMLVPLYEGNGPFLLAAIWSLAMLGIALELLQTRLYRWIKVPIYLAMGWACTTEYANLVATMPRLGVCWLSFGGIAYSIGVIFFLLDNKKWLSHAHGIWHLFVLVGSTSHFISIIGYLH